MNKIKLHPEAREIYTRYYKTFPPVKTEKEARRWSDTKSVNEYIKTVYPYCEYIFLEKTEEFLEAAGYIKVCMGDSIVPSDEWRYIMG